MAKTSKSKTVSFTEYMNKSLSFRGVLTDYCVNKNYKHHETISHLGLLDKFDTKANVNDTFRAEVFAWYNNKVSTVEFRGLALKVGCDYWGNLKNSNIIDTFDSVNIKEC